MSTTVRDFSSPEGRRERAATFHQIQHLPAPSQSPTQERHSRDRRGSVGSKRSNGSNGEYLRQRKVSRANTVTTYHEPYHEPEHATIEPGAEPGIDPAAHDDDQPAHVAKLNGQCEIKIMDYSESDVMESMADCDDLAAFLSYPRPEELPVRWISVNGLNWNVIRTLGNKYNLHPLAIEDLTYTHTRTKVDWYADHAFIVLTFQKLVKLHQHRGSAEKCDCSAAMDSNPGKDEDVDQSPEPDQKPSQRRRWWQRAKKVTDKTGSVLPVYLDRDRDGKIDEFISAHSGLSEDSPIKPIRTLHRYDSSSQVAAQTAWMERHSALAKKDLVVSVEQVALFLLADNLVISFFEQSADVVEELIMKRLRSKATILRRSQDASLLTQALIDVIVDLAVPVKDAYNAARKELQIDALTNPDIRTSRALHVFGEEVDMLQNLFKPIVHLVNALREHVPEPPPHSVPIITTTGTPQSPPAKDQRDVKSSRTKRDRDGAPMFARSISDFRKLAFKRSNTATSVTITPLAHTYFGDVLDHCITMISALEQMDASASNISTLIFNTVGAKTNNFMMILAVVTVLFAPLTFISGYFGMNFASGSGLAHPFSFFWVVAIPSLVGFMVLVFATMLWDNIRDFFEKRGVQAHLRLSTRRMRRTY